MNLEQQVCSLELAKKLKELGVKQESLFKWIMTHYGDGMSNMDFSEEWGVVLVGGEQDLQDGVSAFTVAELGEMLQKAYTNDFLDAYMFVMDLPVGSLDPAQAMHNLMTQPDIAAKMLIYLIENKLITV